jgi:nucleotide-binding universal stress UspA family protein
MPVFQLRGIYNMKIDHILIVANDSRSVKAIGFGFNLAKGLGARVTLLSVIEDDMWEGNTDAGIFPDDALIALKKKAADFLMRIKKKYGQAVHTEVLTHQGETLETVMRVIKLVNINLVVTGSPIRHGLSKLLGNTLAESIVRDSPIPVCIVPIS